MSSEQGTLPHVVVIGGGFGGLRLARRLRRAPVRLTVVDRANHHLFQPLLYQVALSVLSPAEIAMPIRAVLRAQKNARVLLCEAERVDLAGRRVELFDADSLDYDYLVLAAGARTSFFGHDEWAEHALGLKDLDDAIEIRRRVLLAFEQAERERDPQRREELMRFVVVGGGPTGVELAGAIAELGRRVMARDFRQIDPQQTKVVLLEAGPRILPAFDESLSARAAAQLESLGVEVRCRAAVSGIEPDGVRLGDGFIPTWTAIWAAGVRASPLAESLGVALDRAGRVPVRADCSLEGHPEAFAIGDIAGFVPEGAERPLPGVSPVAIQQADLVAANIAADLRGRPRKAFVYRDRGIMATIGRSRAVAQTRRFRFGGWLAWLAWLLVHIWFLIGFRNRVSVMASWFWSYLTFKSGARLITGTCLHPRVRRELEQQGRAPSRTCRE
ncbi:MAG: NAD(P)/FAD-dependent oxidoreductase [Deltaproteobacteria bacterium]|nr:NAD(P)/FAD-dependent oxidoreductase [Deltaproteobacteria bacterium]